ncbi:hypothetical protein [Bibersteinia trehalosi]|uniref:hypothetical protein n=1 Tax=Bibersteinia trehalosi TaxID=47735 RepID=UPI002D78F56E|nr:hypothetical protein [Bibersteinia trehalosi]
MTVNKVYPTDYVQCKSHPCQCSPTCICGQNCGCPEGECRCGTTCDCRQESCKA